MAQSSVDRPTVIPSEAREIAKEAYTYGFPMVDSYRIQYAYFVDRDNPEFKAPWNQIRNIPRVYTPADRTIQTPNSDTPYSMVGARSTQNSAERSSARRSTMSVSQDSGR